MISHPLAKIITFHIFLYISCHSQPPIIPCHQFCCLLLLILKLHLLGHKLFFPSKPTHHLSPLDALMPTFFIFSTTLTTSLSFSFVLFIFSLLFSVPTFQSGLLHSPSALWMQNKHFYWDSNATLMGSWLRMHQHYLVSLQCTNTKKQARDHDIQIFTSLPHIFLNVCTPAKARPQKEACCCWRR